MKNRLKELDFDLKCKTNEEIYDLNKLKIKSEKEQVILTDDIELNQEFIFDFLSKLDKSF